MNKLLRIAIYIIIITLLYLWISTMFDSCGQTDLTDSTQDLISNTEESIDVEQYFEDDEFESGQTIDLSEDDTIYEEQSAENEEEVVEQTPTLDYTELDEVENKTFEEEEYTRPSNNSTTRSTGLSSGRHMVIAGNFLMEANASSMVRRLQNLGYGGAERVVFDNSEYHSVLAIRTNNYATAADVSNELKRNGVDNYIKTRK